MHEPPEIPHFGNRGEGLKIVRGMTFTIEPMINAGTWQRKILSDNWTSVTVDGEPSAQFEHSVAVVLDGIEVLTALPDDGIVKRAREQGAIIYDGSNSWRTSIKLITFRRSFAFLVSFLANAEFSRPFFGHDVVSFRPPFFLCLL